MNKLLNQEVLTHIPHLEEIPFIYGTDGLIFVNSILTKLLKNELKVKIKMDGSPSIIVGYIDDKFFVSTKSLFNKTPKLNFTLADIKKNHSDSDDLQNKLYHALTYLKSSIPNNGLFYQGDLLFTQQDLDRKEIENIDFEIFKPNVIVYAVEYPMLLSKKIGITFHTSYSGGLDNLTSNYDPDLSVLKNSKEVELFHNDLTEFNLSPKTISIIKSICNSLENSKIDFNLIKKFSTEFTKYFNSKIKSGEVIDDSIDQISIDPKVLSDNKQMIQRALKLYNDISKCKEFIINDLIQFVPENIRMYYYKDGEYEPANPEGFVLISDLGIVKLIDRKTFSHNNFNLSKDWD